MSEKEHVEEREKAAARAIRAAKQAERAVARAARRAEQARERGGIPRPPATLAEYQRRVQGLLDALGTGLRSPSRNAVRDALRWHAALGSVEIWQKRPYTAAKAMVRIFDVPFRKVGFAKVCWPDPWDEERGAEVALGKAVCDAVTDNLGQVPFGVFVARLCIELVDEIELCALEGADLVSVHWDYANPFRPCFVQVQNVPVRRRQALVPVEA